MRAIKYLEYPAFTAAQLLYRCSSPMELNLTVVSITQTLARDFFFRDDATHIQHLFL